MKDIKVKLTGYVIIMTCFLISTGCTHERMVKRSQCIPPPFPATQSLDPNEERYRRVDVDKSVQDISEYYNNLLTPIDAEDLDVYVSGTWRMQELTQPYSMILFECSGSVGQLAFETGCIFLHMKGEEETTIEYMWNLGDVAPGCSPQLEQ
ncbi:MAG: hypothetical protein IPJ90_07680 [Anaerolineaceae bacterium]|nr:hypothetical protein [Anaerolineaceae bacterium]